MEIERVKVLKCLKRPRDMRQTVIAQEESVKNKSSLCDHKTNMEELFLQLGRAEQIEVEFDEERPSFRSLQPFNLSDQFRRAFGQASAFKVHPLLKRGA